jgi:hypothetical protein
LNIDKERLRSDRTTQINSVTANFESRINDVSKTENQTVDMWLLVQRYTMPILVIFILLSWVAIVYNEVFMKGAGQTIEVKKVAKKPLLIVVFAEGIYEKIYQLFYWVVGTIIGNKKYQFDDIQQYVVKYELNQNKDTETKLKIQSQNGFQVRQIGYNRNKETENSNDSISNLTEINNQLISELADIKSNFLQPKTKDSNAMNFSNNDNRITKVVTIPKSDVNSNQRTCKNCNELYVYKHHKQTYCKDACRIASWEKRTGKTLKKKSKK